MKVTGFYFSGTGTTEKVVKYLSETLAIRLNVEHNYIDFSRVAIRDRKIEFKKEILVIGVPVIAGRVPNLLLGYLNSIKCERTIAIPIVLFGNRAYDQALSELCDIVENAGACILGAGAFVGEHSFSKLLAKNRPDDNDYKELDLFAEALLEKLNKILQFIEISSDKEIKKILENTWEKPIHRYEVKEYIYYKPIDRYGNHIDIRKVKPETLDSCIRCKKCVNLCPLGSIEDDCKTVSGICMKCCSCIKRCPVQAKIFTDKGFLYHKEELESLFIDRKSNEVFY